MMCRPAFRFGFSAVLLSSALLLTDACIPSASRPSSPPLSAHPQPPLRSATIEHRVHVLINQERRRQGLGTLAWDDALARIARAHSADMGTRSYFSHDSPEGNDFSNRYRTSRYTCSILVGNTVHLGGENIFQNNRYASSTTVNGRVYYDWNSEEEIAETTVRGWMNSPGHRKNILTPYWRKEGIGVYFTPQNKIYITQNFC